MKKLRTYKQFEAKSLMPFEFEIQSEKKFKHLLPDINEIMLESSDEGVVLDISKHIDDIIFEVQLYINKIKTKEQKQAVSDCILRLEEFLQPQNLHIALIKFSQHIGSEKHDFEFYDTSEIWDLQNAAGDLDLEVAFAEHNEN